MMLVPGAWTPFRIPTWEKGDKDQQEKVDSLTNLLPVKKHCPIRAAPY